MPPKITPEGQAAKDRIAEARQNVNLGASPAQARATVREIATPTNRNIQPTISANDLTNPPGKVTPPVPTPSTNDGSRLNTLVGNVAENTQNFITSQSEEAAKAKELASLLGNQTFDGAGQRTALGEQYGLPANLARLTDIQTQLTKRNTESELTKSRIEGAAGQSEGPC